MKIKQINPAVFENLSLEFQTYIDDNITGSVLSAVYWLRINNLVYEALEK